MSAEKRTDDAGLYVRRGKTIMTLPEGITADTAQRSIVRRLNAFAMRNPDSWYPSANGKDLCYYCGIYPRQPNLCESCEAFRQRLLNKFPDERQRRDGDWRDIGHGRLSADDAGLTPLQSIRRPEWMPFKESE